jgi:hypothetical protein
VVREALVVGPVNGASLDEFWKVRTEFITESYLVTAEEYRLKTIQEIERLHALPEDTEICLWFEDDLFCQVNLWFILSLFAKKPWINLFRVFPPEAFAENRWKGFGEASISDLARSYGAKVRFKADDLKLGNDLWQAFRLGDDRKLQEYSKTESPCFKSLVEVCQAQLDRALGSQSLGKPEQIIQEILARGISDFSVVFQEFNKQAGVYGFGDLQVKALYNILFIKP